MEYIGYKLNILYVINYGFVVLNWQTDHLCHHSNSFYIDKFLKKENAKIVLIAKLMKPINE